MPHELIEIADLVKQVGTPIGEISKVFSATAMELDRTNGTFDEGDDFVVTFKDVAGRRSVAWKDEAVERAAEVADLKGYDFTEKQYLDSVAALAKVSAGSRKVELLRR